MRQVVEKMQTHPGEDHVSITHYMKLVAQSWKFQIFSTINHEEYQNTFQTASEAFEAAYAYAKLHLSSSHPLRLLVAHELASFQVDFHGNLKIGRGKNVNSTNNNVEK